jgi:hypothetical protein
MPRGVYKRFNSKAVNEVISLETDDEINARISERFEILSDLTQASLLGNVRAMIVSGPAGVGKSYTVEERLAKWDPKGVKHTIVKGYVRPTGLYKLLYQHADKGKVLVFDDADSIFFDDTSLNMLKAVCDSSKKRTISYMSEGSLYDEDTAVKLPKQFDFNGTIIFISNYDFDHMIDKGHKLAPHLQAMMSRAHYIDLKMKSKRDYMIRIHQVLKSGLLTKNGLNTIAQDEVISFIDDHKDSLRELSLRMALKVAALRKSSPDKWQKMCRVTCCK